MKPPPPPSYSWKFNVTTIQRMMFDVTVCMWHTCPVFITAAPVVSGLWILRLQLSFSVVTTPGLAIAGVCSSWPQPWPLSQPSPAQCYCPLPQCFARTRKHWFTFYIAAWDKRTSLNFVSGMRILFQSHRKVCCMRCESLANLIFAFVQIIARVLK